MGKVKLGSVRVKCVTQIYYPVGIEPHAEAGNMYKKSFKNQLGLF